MNKVKKYIRIKNKYVLNTILQMRLKKQVKLGPKSKGMDFSSYSDNYMKLLINSLEVHFGFNNVKLVVEKE